MIYLLYAWWSIIGLAFLVGVYSYIKAQRASGDSGMVYAIGTIFLGGGSILAALITALIQWLV